jgi:very-short-patch-repair endonuclease
MKAQTNQPRLAKYQRDLRTNSTDVERIIWQHIRARQMRGAKFRRQHVIENYIVDFVSFDAMLIIELDGGQHADQHTYDATRSNILELAGFKIMRFWNSDVTTNLDGVLQAIYAEVARRITPSPSQPPP